MDAIKVLLVDDEPLLRSVIQLYPVRTIKVV